jgi:hypothetical protein
VLTDTLPVTATLRPFARYLLQFSPSWRQAETRKKSASGWLFAALLALRRRLTATVKEVTLCPLWVILLSASLVRLPIIVSRLIGHSSLRNLLHIFRDPAVNLVEHFFRHRGLRASGTVHQQFKPLLDLTGCSLDIGPQGIARRFIDYRRADETDAGLGAGLQYPWIYLYLYHCYRLLKIGAKVQFLFHKS